MTDLPLTVSDLPEEGPVDRLLRGRGSPCTGAVRSTARYCFAGRRSMAYDTILKLVPAFLPWIGKGLFSTLSKRVLNRKVGDGFVRSGRPFIGVLWHQHILLTLELIGSRKAIFLSSRSRDGEISTRILRRMGHGVVRGSSSEGGARALREVIRLLRLGYGALLVADGPKGPARVAKLGCVLAARDSGVPLIPMACALSSSIELRSWDRTAIPFPASSIVVGFGDPIDVPRSSDRSTLESIRRDLDLSMARLEGRCRSALPIRAS